MCDKCNDTGVFHGYWHEALGLELDDPMDAILCHMNCPFCDYWKKPNPTPKAILLPKLEVHNG